MVLMSSSEWGRVGNKIGLVGERAANIGEPYEGFAAPQCTEGMIHEPVFVLYAGWWPEGQEDEMKSEVSQTGAVQVSHKVRYRQINMSPNSRSSSMQQSPCS